MILSAMLYTFLNLFEMCFEFYVAAARGVVVEFVNSYRLE